MTTVRIYNSDRADVRLVVRRRRKHGRPRGRGAKAWRLRWRVALAHGREQRG